MGKVVMTTIFTSVYLTIEQTIKQEVLRYMKQADLVPYHVSLHGMDIGWNAGEVEIAGFDKFKGIEFIIYYPYQKQIGCINYENGEIYSFQKEEGKCY